jgi:hypothetical protein
VKLNLPEVMDRVPKSAEIALFRILQESLTNAHRHSSSPLVEINLMVEINLNLAEGHVRLSVRDFGRGIPGVNGRFRPKRQSGQCGHALSSSPPAKRTFHVLSQPDLSCATAHTHTQCLDSFSLPRAVLSRFNSRFLGLISGSQNPDRTGSDCAKPERQP